MITFQALKATKEYQTLKAAMGERSSTVALFGMPPAARAQMVALLCKELGKKAVVVTEGEASATRFAADISFFGVKSGLFPSRDLMMRPVEGQNHEFEYRRLQTLGEVIGGRCDVVVASVEGALQFTVPKEEFLQNTLTVKKGMEIRQELLIEALYGAGYYRRPLVEGPGQFSVRGGIVDIFPPDSAQPARLEFWGDTVDTMTTFDLLTQRRDGNLRKLHISPAREVLLSDIASAKDLLEQELKRRKGASREQFAEACAQDLKLLEGGVLPGTMDKYLPLRYERPGTLFDYMEDAILFIDEPSAVREAAAGLALRFSEEIKVLFEQKVLARGLDHYYEDHVYLLRRCDAMPSILCENFARTIADVRLSEVVDAPSHALPPWNGVMSTLAEDLAPLMEQGYSAVVLAGTKRAANALQRDLENAGFRLSLTVDADPAPGTVAVTVGGLTSGVEYPFAKFALITGRGQNTAPVKRKKPKSKGLTSLDDIKPGDYVVHQNHGIGVYSGIHRIDLQGVVKDYIKVSYDKGDTLYLPVTQLDLLSRYTAPGDGEKVKLSKLGGTEWTKTKTRVKKATQEMAKELIELYAKRQMAPGFAFPEDGDWQRDFETRFEFDETDDQIIAIREIKKDMEKPHPMDRLLCGDVGVGKTEVALRAAFKCIMGGKQVAVLVPTTILAWQHYNTFLRRLEAFPVSVGMLSRFRSLTQQKQTVKNLAAGTCDLVVGTHRLLQKDIHFKDLGLIIVDEEQRFGVKHKEKLKEGFPGVDVLTLSATPIPRTLNMAMSGIRDMSTIEEPPFDRQPVETYVMEYEDGVIEQALRKELSRGGQVYYLHNRIDSIERCASHLAQLVPEARLGLAHGRMSEDELSAVWQRLLDGEIDILVCTTLIETGVDVRNCNTLIIEDADRMGLAQLYQLRGRVGRSGRKAYAYFTFRRDKVLTDVAAKRLSAIREFTNFGSGFRIAMRDLQIRGAGNLLGQSQHGHMEAVGYDMYVKMLNQAIAELRGEVPAADKSDCLIDITVDAYIPEKYIPEISGRIEMYKRIAAIETDADAADVLDELEDRYGKVPKSVHGLIDISLIRVVAAKLGIYEITQKRDTLLLYSDHLRMEELKPLLRDMDRRVTVNASAKPYLSVRVLSGEAPVDVMTAALSRIAACYGGEAEQR